MAGISSLAHALEPILLLAASQPADRAPDIPAHNSAEPIRPAVSSITISLPVTLDGRYSGDIQIGIAGELVTFPAERFVQLIQADVTAATTNSITQGAAAGILTPQAASVGGLQVRYDPGLQELQVFTLIAARNRRVLNVSPGEGADARDRKSTRLNSSP